MAKKKVQSSSKPSKEQIHKLGHYAFFVGLVLVVAFAFVSDQVTNLTRTSILMILGLVVGLLNITRKESSKFLIASLVLIIAPSATAITIGTIDPVLTEMWTNVVIFVATSAIVVATKVIYELAEDY